MRSRRKRRRMPRRSLRKRSRRIRSMRTPGIAGRLQLSQKNTEGARTSFGQAIAADPKLVTPYVELAILDARDGKWKETAESTGKAIRLDPVDFPVAFYFDAVANYNLQNFEAAEKSARQLQKLDTQHHYPMADRILASVLADRKDYSGAAQQMRNYLKFAGTAKDADEVRGQLQQIEKLITRTIGDCAARGTGAQGAINAPGGLVEVGLLARFIALLSSLFWDNSGWRRRGVPHMNSTRHGVASHIYHRAGIH